MTDSKYLWKTIMVCMVVAFFATDGVGGPLKTRRIIKPYKPYKLPKYNIPKYNIPKYNLPKYNIPKYNAPKYNIPNHDLLKIKKPIKFKNTPKVPKTKKKIKSPKYNNIHKLKPIQGGEKRPHKQGEINDPWSNFLGAPPKSIKSKNSKHKLKDFKGLVKELVSDPTPEGVLYKLSDFQDKDWRDSDSKIIDKFVSLKKRRLVGRAKDLIAAGYYENVIEMTQGASSDELRRIGALAKLAKIVANAGEREDLNLSEGFKEVLSLLPEGNHLPIINEASKSIVIAYLRAGDFRAAMEILSDGEMGGVISDKEFIRGILQKMRPRRISSGVSPVDVSIPKDVTGERESIGMVGEVKVMFKGELLQEIEEEVLKDKDWSEKDEEEYQEAAEDLWNGAGGGGRLPTGLAMDKPPRLICPWKCYRVPVYIGAKAIGTKMECGCGGPN